jgi:uncharacterized RmlC-like cupin family protein
MKVVRAGGAISQATAGAHNITMKVQVVPPGARSQPHFHEGFESVVYVLRGELRLRWGDQLEQSEQLGPGDMLYVPPQETHVVENPSDDEPTEYVVARDSPTEDAVTVPWADHG